MTEKEFEEKIWSKEADNFDGTVWEFLGMTKEEYKKTIHCKYCKKPKWERKFCDPHNPYCCSIIIN